MSSAQSPFSRIDNMVGHKTSLKNFKKIEIISSIISGHNGIKLEINSRRKTRRITDLYKLNSTLLDHNFVKEEKREIGKYLKANENENTVRQNVWDTAEEVLRGKFILMNAYIKTEERSQ